MTITPADSAVSIVPTGPDALAALVQAVAAAQADDPFARVVVIAEHPDTAQSIRHLLGAHGTINVTVQTGRRLARELAQPSLKPLTRLLESQAVRQVAEGKAAELGLEPAGRSRFYRSLSTAFHDMQEGVAGQDAGSGEKSDMNRLAESLFVEYRDLLVDKGYYAPSDLPRMAADAVADPVTEGSIPTVIYYLPRRLSTGEVDLARSFLDRGGCRVIAGLTGDGPADAPILELLNRLGFVDGEETVKTAGGDTLRERAAAGAISIVTVPDPEEEVRMVIRSVAASDTPFHRTAVMYRQDSPYASLLRQELAFAGIPFSGTDRRTLADTQTGRLLLGLVDLAVSLNVGPEGTIEREGLIEWLTTTVVKYQPQSGDGESLRWRPAPSTRWANLMVAAQANGTVANYQSRLTSHLGQMERLAMERGDGDSENATIDRWRRQVGELKGFMEELERDLQQLGGMGVSGWELAAVHLKTLIEKYRWSSTEESDEDRQRIDEQVAGLASLQDWGSEYSTQALQEVIRESLQSPVSDRGRSVGDGVYLGPPAAIAGGQYDVVHAVGMVERQFPPRPRANPWLAENPAELQQALALDRYDFLAAIAAANNAVLYWPAATADRNSTYPSRWLIEAANLLHEEAGGNDRLTYENMTADAESKSWLTVISSRDAGLRQLAGAAVQPADAADYNLMHLISQSGTSIALHPAVASDTRMTNALDARAARNGDALSFWDGRVDSSAERVAAIGSRVRPVSPSSLEAWATCPYKYFLSRVLGLSAPPEDEGEEITALERGTLVHKIMEKSVNEKKWTLAELLALAEEEFDEAEARGVTGYHLLWEMEKESMREALSGFWAAEERWLNGAVPVESYAEADFGPPSTDTEKPTTMGEVSVAVDGLAEPVWLRGKIDRVDVLEDEIRVRDFKTGKPENYRPDRRNTRTVANGMALQPPIYREATVARHEGKPVIAAFCFPLADANTHDVAKYTGTEDQQQEFQQTLSGIVGAARAGIFPATPDGEGRFSNCNYCDFNRLCPTRRRQTWERKARHDAALVAPFNDLGGKAAMAGTNDDDS